jgi:hypothetical protein
MISTRGLRSPLSRPMHAAGSAYPIVPRIGRKRLTLRTGENVGPFCLLASKGMEALQMFERRHSESSALRGH